MPKWNELNLKLVICGGVAGVACQTRVRCQLCQLFLKGGINMKSSMMHIHV
jgi:hypothetical protein